MVVIHVNIPEAILAIGTGGWENEMCHVVSAPVLIPFLLIMG